MKSHIHFPYQCIHTSLKLRASTVTVAKRAIFQFSANIRNIRRMLNIRRIFKMNIRPILNIRPIFWPNITFGVTAGPGDAIKQFGLACPTQNTIPGQYRPGYMVYWVLGAQGLPVEFKCPHCHGVGWETANGAGMGGLCKARSTYHHHVPRQPRLSESY